VTLRLIFRRVLGLPAAGPSDADDEDAVEEQQEAKQHLRGSPLISDGPGLGDITVGDRSAYRRESLDNILAMPETSRSSTDSFRFESK
jgi:hypothetical protein